MNGKKFTIDVKNRSKSFKNIKSTRNAKNKATAVFDDTPSDVSRDERYKDILRAQLGEQGIALTTNLSFLFILSLILLILIMTGLLVTRKDASSSYVPLRLPKPVLIDPY